MFVMCIMCCVQEEVEGQDVVRVTLNYMPCSESLGKRLHFNYHLLIVDLIFGQMF